MRGFCKSGVGYPAPRPEDQPAALRNLTEEIVEALRPLAADPGPLERADQGYRLHAEYVIHAVGPRDRNPMTLLSA